MRCLAGVAGFAGRWKIKELIPARLTDGAAYDGRCVSISLCVGISAIAQVFEGATTLTNEPNAVATVTSLL